MSNIKCKYFTFIRNKILSLKFVFLPSAQNQKVNIKLSNIGDDTGVSQGLVFCPVLFHNKIIVKHCAASPSIFANDTSVLILQTTYLCTESILLLILKEHNKLIRNKERRNVCQLVLRGQYLNLKEIVNTSIIPNKQVQRKYKNLNNQMTGTDLFKQTLFKLLLVLTSRSTYWGN